MKKNIFKLTLLLCAFTIVAGCLISQRPPVDFPERYSDWWLYQSYAEKPNSKIFGMAVLFLNYEILKIPHLEDTMVVTRVVLKRLKKKRVDYSKYVSFSITIFCKNYTEINEVFQNPLLLADNKKFDLDNYVMDKKTEKVESTKKTGPEYYGIIEIIGKIPKDEFIEMSESEKLSLQFEVMGEPYNVVCKDINVYEDTFVVP